MHILIDNYYQIGGQYENKIFVSHANISYASRYIIGLQFYIQ